MTLSIRLPTYLIFVLLISTASQAQEISIGVASAQTGPAASIGQQIVSAARLAVDDINRAGTASGKTIRLVPADDSCHPAEAAVKAKELVERYRVVFVVGHQCNSASLAAARVYSQNQIPVITPTADTRELTELQLANVFRLAAREDHAQKIAAALIKPLESAGTLKFLTTESTPAWLNQVRSSLSFPTEVSSTQDPNSFHLLVASRWIAAAEAERIGGTSKVYFVAPSSRSDFLMIGRRDVLMRLPDSEAAINAYAAVEIWHQTTQAIGTTDGQRVIDKMKSTSFSTVRGSIRFDAKGDIRQPVLKIMRRMSGTIEVPNECKEPRCSNCACSICCN